jgi:hypothetical protein
MGDRTGRAAGVRIAPERQARRVLEDHLAQLWWASREASSERAVALRKHLDRTLEVMFGFDLVGPAEIAAWSERADRLVAAGFPAGEEQAATRARGHLASLTEAEPTARAAAAVAFRSLGVLSLDDLDALRDTTDGDEEADFRPPAVPDELRRVVVVGTAATPHLDLLSVELYTGAVILRWHAILTADQWPTPPRAAVDPWAMQRQAIHGEDGVRLADPLGTTYEPFNVGSQARPAAEHQRVVHWSEGFTPSVPTNASGLTVATSGTELRVELE